MSKKRHSRVAAEAICERTEDEIRNVALFPEENPNPVLRASAEGVVLYANRPARTLLESFGRGSGDVLPEPLFSAVPRVLASGDTEVLPVTCPRGLTWSFAVTPIAKERYVNFYAQEITERMRAEEALRQSQDDLNHAQAVARTGSWRLDVRHNRLLWSDENHRIFGISPGTPMTYETFLATVHPEDRAYVHQEWTAALRGEPYDIEHRIVVGDEVKWVRERAELEFDRQGTLLGGFGTTQDVTERKQTEEALARFSRQRMRLVEISARVVAQREPDKLHATVVEGARELTEAKIGACGHLGEDGRLHMEAASWAEGPPSRPACEVFTFEGGSFCLDLIENHASFRYSAAELRDHPVWQAATDAHAPLRGLLGARLVDADGKPNGLILVSDRQGGGEFDEDDESLLRQLAAVTSLALQHIEARRAAESANRAKSQFLASMSHELRTPMSAILGMTDLALGEEIPDAVRDYLQTAKASAGLLLELLNQILDFSRIEAGRFDLEAAPFHLPRAIEQVVKMLAVRAYEKDLELVYGLADDLPQRVVGDQLRLRQVLMNLVSNAIKFTARGEVVVRAEVEEETCDGARLKFSVSDTGIGIAPEDRERIFSPFAQADASTTRHYGGSGLGLAIARRLVEMMGGEIWVESRPGEGSTFSFTVALPVDRQEGGQPETALPDREALRDLPALIVTPSATNRRILQETLAGWSMRPDAAAGVPVALATIHEAAAAGRGYRLVLADAVMPGIDGFTLAEWLRAEPSLAGPVILMLSATDRQTHFEKLRRTTALCLEKPIARSSLFSSIAKTLGGKAADAPCGCPDPMAAPKRPLKVLLAEDTPANQMLVLHVLGKRGHSVEIAENGRQALELLERHDFDAVLMDVEMPQLDGFQATVAIRKMADPKKARLPIIALTAHALKGDRQRCTDAGMDAYLAKPILRDELIELVERMAGPGDAGRKKAGRQSGRPGRVGAPDAAASLRPAGSRACSPAGAEPAFSLDEGIRLCFHDYGIFQKMAGFFLGEVDPLLERMRSALTGGDGEELARAAHRLRNTLTYLGAAWIADRTKAVERMGRSGELASAGEAVEELAPKLDALKTALAAHLPKPA